MKTTVKTAISVLNGSRTWRLGATLAALCCAAATTMAQTTHTVAAGGGGDFTTIAAAIEAAAPGATIHVIESPHTEYGITINKDLTIKGDGASQTIIQGHAERDTAGDRLFLITTASTVIFEDLTLQHGRTTAASYGGAIRINAAAQTTIRRCHIKDNNAYRSGGGVYASSAAGSTLTVLDSTFSGNVTDYGSSQGASGGAISAGAIDQLLVSNCTFFDNLASSTWSYGGAISTLPEEGQTALIRNSTFVNNRSYREGVNTGGGAIRGSATQERVLVESCVFQGNQARNSNYGSCMYRVSILNTVYHTTASGCTDLGGNTVTSDAKVATVLADNGGPTPTLALLEGSPAIDTGSNPGGLDYDQRGPGYARQIGAGVDAGAFEYLAGPISLSYSTDTFSEKMPENDGSIDNILPMTITLDGYEAFAASIDVGTEVLVDNLPAGLAAVFTRDSDQQISVTLTGNVASHGDADNVDDLEFAFQDAAFAINGNAALVGNATRSDLKIDFYDETLPPVLTYNGTEFTEAAANDGSIETTFTIELTYDTFAGDVGTNYVAGGHVLASNLPAGLTAVVEKTDDLTVTVSLTGQAELHNSAHDVANLTLDFQDSALAGGDASNLVNNPKDDLTITFINPVATFHGTGAFTEAVANDGSIGNSFTITLVGDTFSGNVDDDLVAGGKATGAVPPAGLAWRVNRDSDTQLTVGFSGNAIAHNAANSVAGLSLTLNDSAFAMSDAAEVADSSRDDYSITFMDPALTYSATAFYESTADDGTVPDTVAITLAGDTFTGSNGDDFAGTKVLVSNVPSGLTARLERVGATQLTASFVGTAASHDASASVNNVTFAFQNSAFAGNDVSIVDGTTRDDLSVLFREAYYVNQASGDDGNDGTSGAPWASLAHAAATAPDNSVIRVMHSPHTESGIVLASDLILQGQGANQTIVQAAGSRDASNGRILLISGPRHVTLRDLTLRHGGADHGGALYWDDSGVVLTIQRCIVRDNDASSGGGGIRGIGGSLTVLDSVFSGNTAAYYGGMGASSLSHGVVRNSTFSGNTAVSSASGTGAAGILFAGSGINPLIQNCTFVNNRTLLSGAWAGAISGSTIAANRPHAASCVFAGNTSNGDLARSRGSDMHYVAFMNCVYQGDHYGSNDLGGNTQTLDAGVDPNLANNGGKTPTHALLEGSLAIDAGSNPANLVYDQRGRPFERVFGDAADCGAYEFGAGKPVGTIMILR